MYVSRGDTERLHASLAVRQSSRRAEHAIDAERGGAQRSVFALRRECTCDGQHLASGVRPFQMKWALTAACVALRCSDRRLLSVASVIVEYAQTPGSLTCSS